MLKKKTLTNQNHLAELELQQALKIQMIIKGETDG
jgi:hypothetical protein